MPAPADPGVRQAVVAFARKQIGKPYVWGGTGPNGYDCSGLVYAAYAAAGHPIGARTSEQQWAACTHISEADLQPGDPVFFRGAVDAQNPSPAHEAMSLGGDSLIVAPHSGARVEYDSLTRLSIADTYVGSGNFLGDATAATPGPASQPSPGDLSGAGSVGCACWALPEALGFHSTRGVCRYPVTCREYARTHGRLATILRVASCNPVTAR